MNPVSQAPRLGAGGVSVVIAELDGVRGLAILLVVAAHTGAVGSHAGGAVGVTLFFVLSGYLITGILARDVAARGRVDLKAFWARRARRLLPAFGLLAGVFLLLFVMAGLPGRGLRLLALVPVADFPVWVGMPSAPIGQTWSLAVEEHFYLVWPLLVGWVVTRRRPVQGLLAVAALSATWRVVGVLAGWDWFVYKSPDANAFGLLAGAALALAGWRLKWWWAAAAVVILVVLSWVPLTPSQVSLTTVPAAALAVVVVAGCRGVPGLSWRPLRFLGTVSYGWYLWHWPIMTMLPEGSLARLLSAGVTLAFAALSWHLVERPILKRKKAPRHRPASVATAVVPVAGPGPLLRPVPLSAAGPQVTQLVSMTTMRVRSTDPGEHAG